MVEKKKRVRLARMMRNGVICGEEESCSEDMREKRMKLLRRPCSCGNLGNVLIAADIEVDEGIITRWELALVENDMETAFTPNQKVVWKEIKYCPFCGRLLPIRIDEDKVEP